MQRNDCDDGDKSTVADSDIDESQSETAGHQAWDFPLTRRDKHLRVIDLYRKELDAISRESEEFCKQLYREREDIARNHEAEVARTQKSAQAECEALSRDLATFMKESQYLQTKNKMLLQQTNEAVQNAKLIQAKMDGERRDKQQLESIAHQLSVELQKHKKEHVATVHKLQSENLALQKHAREHEGAFSTLQAEIRSLLSTHENSAREMQAIQEKLRFERAQKATMEAALENRNERLESELEVANSSSRRAEELSAALVKAQCDASKAEQRMEEMESSVQRATIGYEELLSELHVELVRGRKAQVARETSHSELSVALTQAKADASRAQEEKNAALKQVEVEHAEWIRLEAVGERATEQIQQQIHKFEMELQVVQVQTETALQQAVEDVARAEETKNAALKQVNAERADSLRIEVVHQQLHQQMHHLQEELHATHVREVEALKQVELEHSEKISIEAAHGRATKQIHQQMCQLHRVTSGYDEKCAALHQLEAAHERASEQIQPQRHRFQEELHVMHAEKVDMEMALQQTTWGYEELRLEYAEMMRIEEKSRNANDVNEIRQQMHHLHEELHITQAEKVDIQEELHITRSDKVGIETALQQAKSTYEDLCREMLLRETAEAQRGISAEELRAALAQAQSYVSTVLRVQEENHAALSGAEFEHTERMRLAAAREQSAEQIQQHMCHLQEELHMTQTEMLCYKVDMESKLQQALVNYEEARADREVSREKCSAAWNRAEVEHTERMRIESALKCATNERMRMEAAHEKALEQVRAECVQVESLREELRFEQTERARLQTSKYSLHGLKVAEGGINIEDLRKKFEEKFRRQYCASTGPQVHMTGFEPRPAPVEDLEAYRKLATWSMTNANFAWNAECLGVRGQALGWVPLEQLLSDTSPLAKTSRAFLGRSLEKTRERWFSPSSIHGTWRCGQCFIRWPCVEPRCKACNYERPAPKRPHSKRESTAHEMACSRKKLES